VTTVEEYVGLRIRDRREELGLSAVEFGCRLGKLLEKPWPRQAVSAAELGKRSLGAAEMVAVAHVLRATVSELFTPPAKVTVITMPSGAVFPASMVFAAYSATPREDWSLSAIQETIDGLKASTARSRELADDLDELIVQRVADGGVVRAPYATGMEPDES
jgi:transcriptional regulator with XRE-family HTH domain